MCKGLGGSRDSEHSLIAFYRTNRKYINEFNKGKQNEAEFERKIGHGRFIGDCPSYDGDY